MLSDSHRHSVLTLLGWLRNTRWIILLIPAPYCLGITKLTGNKFIIHIRLGRGLSARVNEGADYHLQKGKHKLCPLGQDRADAVFVYV